MDFWGFEWHGQLGTGERFGLYEIVVRVPNAIAQHCDPLATVADRLEKKSPDLSRYRSDRKGREIYIPGLKSEQFAKFRQKFMMQKYNPGGQRVLLWQRIQDAYGLARWADLSGKDRFGNRGDGVITEEEMQMLKPEEREKVEALAVLAQAAVKSYRDPKAADPTGDAAVFGDCDRAAQHEKRLVEIYEVRASEEPVKVEIRPGQFAWLPPETAYHVALVYYQRELKAIYDQYWTGHSRELQDSLKGGEGSVIANLFLPADHPLKQSESLVVQARSLLEDVEARINMDRSYYRVDDFWREYQGNPYRFRDFKFNIENWQEWAHEFFNRGDYVKALHWHKRIIDSYPYPANEIYKSAVFRIAECYVQLNDQAKALGYYKKYVALSPPENNRLEKAREAIFLLDSEIAPVAGSKPKAAGRPATTSQTAAVSRPASAARRSRQRASVPVAAAAAAEAVAPAAAPSPAANNGIYSRRVE